MSKVKVIATLGPSSESDEVISKLSIYVHEFRINFSHRNEESWLNLVNKVRGYSNLPIIGDLKDPRVRIGYLEKNVEINEGDAIKVKLNHKSNGEYIPIPNREFFETIEVGMKSLLMMVK